MVDPEEVQFSYSQYSPEERIAVLESTVFNEPKGFLAKAKEWGGILSLGIALAYSFPLGLWDRFVVPVEKAKQQQILDLRKILAETSKINMEAGVALSNIVDPRLKDGVSRAANTQIYLLMLNNKSGFIERVSDFSASESLVIGYNFLNTNQVKLAIDFFEKAANTSSVDPVTHLESLRLHAKTLFLPSDHQNIEKAREVFSSGVKKFQSSSNLHIRQSVMSMYADWGMLEMADGSWNCGVSKLELAKEHYRNLAPYLNDNGNFLRLIDNQVGALNPRGLDDAPGC